MIIPRFLLKPIVKGLLKMHSLSYNLAGRLSCHLEPNLLHPKHRIMNYHQYFMDHVKADDVVLDVGCGNGALALDVATRCKKIIGIDLSEKSIREAQGRASQRQTSNVEFVAGDATKFPFKDKVDCVILSNVLEHIEFRKDMLEKLKLLSNRFLIRVPMMDREWIAVYKKEMGMDYRLDNTHFIEYTFKEFEEELKSANLTLQQHQIQFGEIWSSCVTQGSNK